MTSDRRLRLEHRPQLWFERVFGLFHLGVIGGSVVIGGGVFAFLTVVAFFFSGAPSSFVIENDFVFVPFALILITLVNYGSALVASRVETLKQYAESMTREGKSTTISYVYSTKFSMITVLVVQAFVQPIYIFTVLPQSLSLTSKTVSSLPYFYWGFFIGSFIWVFTYSLYGVYKLGRLPLTLTPFTEDRTLGLRPFGRISLLLATIYLAMITILLIPQLLTGNVTLSVLLIMLSLLIVALVFFLLPLVPLRGKLVRAKRETLGWIGARYTTAVENLRNRGDAPVDEALVNELMVVDKIQRDANQIHTWPFDTGILIRLTAIVLTVVGIVVARVVQLALHLTT